MISIIFVNYFNAELIKKAVIPFIDLPDFQIIIVDNSKESKVLKEITANNITIIQNSKNVGFAAACNMGVKKSIGEYILFLNPDSVISKTDVFKLRSTVESIPKSIAGPVTFLCEHWMVSHPHHISPIFELKKALAERFKWFNTLFFNMSSRIYHKKPTTLIRNASLSGGCFMIKRTDIIKDKLIFDETYFMYFEDTDLFLRARKNGYSLIIHTGAKCFHKSIITEKKLNLMYQSMSLYLNKNYSDVISRSVLKLNSWIRKKIKRITPQIEIEFPLNKSSIPENAIYMQISTSSSFVPYTITRVQSDNAVNLPCPVREVLNNRHYVMRFLDASLKPLDTLYSFEAPPTESLLNGKKSILCMKTGDTVIWFSDNQTDFHTDVVEVINDSDSFKDRYITVTRNMKMIQTVVFVDMSAFSHYIFLISNANKYLPINGKLIFYDTFKTNNAEGFEKTAFEAYAIRSGFDLHRPDTSKPLTEKLPHLKHSTLSESVILTKTHDPEFYLFPGTEYMKHIQKLYSEVFKKTLSENFWLWKYGNGNGESIVAEKNGRIIAHYGGMKRVILNSGHLETSIQPCDTMVLQSERGRLKSGPFFQCAATFLENYIGTHSSHQIGYGFPNEKVMKIAEKMKLYKSVGEIIEISRAALNQFSTSVLSYSATAFSECKDRANRCNRIWNCMKHDFSHSIVGVRDWKYIESRYINHPEYRYLIFLITERFSTKDTGMVIIKDTENSWFIMDIISRLSDMKKVWHAASVKLQRISKKKEVFWVNKESSEHFPENLFNCSKTHINIPCNIWSDGPPCDTILNKWYLTAGDSDYL